MTPVSVIASELHSGRQGTISVVRPLRIAMLSIHSSPLGELGTEETGGMSVYIRELSQELGKVGHKVDIYTCADSRSGENRLLLSENVRLVHLDLGYNGRITKDALSGHLPKVFQALETYVSSRDACYDLIHSNYWLSGEVGGLAQSKWYIPHVMMFHTTGIAKRLACGEEREPTLRVIAEKRIADKSDRVLTATQNEKDLLVRYYGVPKGKIGIVPCGVNLDRFRPVSRELARKELGLQDTRFLVLYVGRFAPIKGLSRLIAAAAHLRSHRGLRFVIVGGDGRQTRTFAKLNRLARRAYVDNIVRFEGRVKHNLLPLYYSAADILVVPSYYESFGLVALESLACGTPVIATRVGAIDTLIKDGETGLRIEDPSPRALASVIEKFMAAPSGIGLSRDEIRASVLSYGWSNIASAVLHEYATALQPYNAMTGAGYRELAHGSIC